jgi:hypothetical protein
VPRGRLLELAALAHVTTNDDVWVTTSDDPGPR